MPYDKDDSPKAKAKFAFQKKGSASAAKEESEAPPTKMGSAKTVTCPNCQCEFDPKTGEITNEGEY